MGNQCDQQAVDVEAHCSLHEGGQMFLSIFFFLAFQMKPTNFVFLVEEFLVAVEAGCLEVLVQKTPWALVYFFPSKWLISLRHQGEAGRLKPPITRLSLNSTCSWTHLALLGCIDVRAYANMG